MADQQQIEKWKEEFESHYPNGFQQDTSVSYGNYSVQLMWQGFVMAKRAQKPVVLKPTEVIINENRTDYFMLASDVKKAIDTAGYTYTVKGE